MDPRDAAARDAAKKMAGEMVDTIRRTGLQKEGQYGVVNSAFDKVLSGWSAEKAASWAWSVIFALPSARK